MTDVTGSGEMLPSIVPAHGLVVVGDGPGRHIRVETDEATPPSLPSGIRAKSLDLLTLCWCRGPGSSYARVCRQFLDRDGGWANSPGVILFCHPHR